jgi:hypothetical protein
MSKFAAFFPMTSEYSGTGVSVELVAFFFRAWIYYFPVRS